MISDKSLRIAFVVICLSFLGVLMMLNSKLTKYHQMAIELNKLKNQNEYLQNKIDTLHDELIKKKLNYSEGKGRMKFLRKDIQLPRRNLTT